tara:strand:- start:3371 stop:4132 length:762 start_codon:yes stop_codon:yes gene_type:complete
MRSIRLIARLDIKAPFLVKGIQLEGLRKIGDPNEFAKKYYKDGIDEIYYEDIVASLYERNSLLEIISKTSEEIFVPVTVGGGLRKIDDIEAVLRSGADKISINTAAIKEPKIINNVAEKFGTQCMVLSIQAKKNGSRWEAYFDNGREKSGLDAIEWAIEGEKRGAGEIIITSVDREGTERGYDAELIRAITDSVAVPVIASGGMGKFEDIKSAVKNGNADAVAIANCLHYNKMSVREIREYCLKNQILVRKIK